MLTTNNNVNFVHPLFFTPFIILLPLFLLALYLVNYLKIHHLSHHYFFTSCQRFEILLHLHMIKYNDCFCHLSSPYFLSSMPISTISSTAHYRPLSDPCIDISKLLLDHHPRIVIVASCNKEITLNSKTQPTSSVLNRSTLTETTSTQIVTIIPNNHPIKNQNYYLDLGWNNRTADYILQLLATTTLFVLLLNSNMVTLSLYYLVIGSMLITML